MWSIWKVVGRDPQVLQDWKRYMFIRVLYFGHDYMQHEGLYREAHMTFSIISTSPHGKMWRRDQLCTHRNQAPLTDQLSERKLQHLDLYTHFSPGRKSMTFCRDGSNEDCTEPGNGTDSRISLQLGGLRLFFTCSRCKAIRLPLYTFVFVKTPAGSTHRGKMTWLKA